MIAAAAFKKRHIHFKTTMDGMNDVVVVVVDGEGKGSKAKCVSQASAMQDS